MSHSLALLVALSLSAFHKLSSFLPLFPSVSLCSICHVLPFSSPSLWFSNLCHPRATSRSIASSFPSAATDPSPVCATLSLKFFELPPSLSPGRENVSVWECRSSCKLSGTFSIRVRHFLSLLSNRVLNFLYCNFISIVSLSVWLWFEVFHIF